MKVKLDLSVAGIDRAIKELDKYQLWLDQKAQELVLRLAAKGLSIASARFATAQYDGENDVRVSIELREKGVCAVVATGNAALFIEFGTGITYPDDHPEADDLGIERGSYGQGKGSQRTWGYYGVPGTHGIVSKETCRGQLVLTHGNPANMPMYLTVRELESLVRATAREVFR